MLNINLSLALITVTFLFLSFNLIHIIDLFRFCARSDKILSQALEGDFTGFIFESETKQAPEQKMDIATYEPQPKSMEVESQ